MPTGKVRFFNEQRGFGFIQPDDGRVDLFVHVSALREGGLDTLEEDAAVTFDVVPGREGKVMAVNVRLL